MPDTLPEGTDTIITGNAAGGSTSSASASAASSARDAAEDIKGEAADLRGKASAKAEEIKTQATDKARDYAEQGKARATGALDEVARLIGENAGQIDGAIGAQYGDYARRAAGAVSGFSDTLRDKDVEELIEDARELVRRSPTIALSAAAAAGFLLARVIKSGSEAIEQASTRSVAAKSSSKEAPITAEARKAPKSNSSRSSDD